MIANAVPKTQESLTGIRKAAMLLILLGDKASAEIIKQLSEDEVQLVSREIARLEAIPAENAEELLEEFYQMNLAHDFVVRGGLDYAKKMLNQAFGPEVAQKLIDRLSKAIGGEYRQPRRSAKGRPAAACQVHPQRTPADDRAGSFPSECFAGRRSARLACRPKSAPTSPCAWEFSIRSRPRSSTRSPPSSARS